MTIPLAFMVTDSAINPTQPIIYFSDKSNKKLHEINYETGGTREISFDYPPENITFANGNIYLSLLKGQHDRYWAEEDQSGAFAVVDANTFTKTSQYDILTDPFSIAADSVGNVYISGGSGQLTSIRSFNNQGVEISKSGIIWQGSKILLHPKYDRLYAVSLSNNTYLKNYDISKSGIISNTIIEKSYGYVEANNETISPDGKYLFVNYSDHTKIFMCDQNKSDDLIFLANISNGAREMAFDIPNNRFFMCNGSNQINIYDYDYMEKSGTLNATNKISKLYFKEDKFIAVTLNSSNQFSIEKIPSSNIVQVPFEGSADPYSVKLHGVIKDTVYNENKAYSIDGAFNHLLITDLVTRQIVKQAKLPYKPTGLCISEDKTKIYITNFNSDYPITELDINTGQVLRNLKYKVYTGYDYGSYREAHKQIYNKEGKLYFVGGSSKLYIFDASTFNFISSPIDQIGDIAFSKDNNYLYFRYIYNGYGQNFDRRLHKYSISGNTISEVGTSEIDIVGPNDIPILFADDRDALICKRNTFKQSDLTSSVYSFPVDIYAIDTNANIAVGMDGLYNLDIGSKIQDFSFEGSKSFYFDNESTLYYEKNSVLKISKLIDISTNSSQESMGKNELFQIGVFEEYSDGRSKDITNLATFESSNPDVAQVARNGLISTINMGTTYITVHYSGFIKVIKVDVALGLNSTQIIGVWERKADMVHERMELTAVSCNGRIYAFGSHSDTVEEYNPETNKWKIKTSIPGVTTRMSTVELDGMIYIIGGEYSNQLIAYDPVSNTWAKKKDMNSLTSGESAAAIVYNGKIYVAGGNGYKTMEVYDPQRDIWEYKASMNFGRWFHCLAVVNDKMYAIGGYGTENEIEEYDFEKDTWTKKPQLPFEFSNGGGAVIDGKLYLIGGADSRDIDSKRMIEYNPINNTCTDLISMIIPRQKFALSVLDNTVYVIGGTSYWTSILKSVESFRFTKPTPTNPISGWIEDINQDKAVNMLDVVLIAQSFGKALGDNEFNSKCDLNKDNLVNMADVVILGLKFGSTLFEDNSPSKIDINI